MTRTEDIKKRQSALKDILVKALNACKQLGAVHKHASYKTKRLNELDIIWKEFQKNDAFIESTDEFEDQEYERLQGEIKLIYQEYMALLENIKNDSNNDGTGQSNDGHNDDQQESIDQTDEEYDRLWKSQHVRFDSFIRMCDQILSKKNAGEIVSTSFGKIKINLINSSWERIATGHEMLGSAGIYTTHYVDRITQCEAAMEESLLFLQEIMDRPKNLNDGIKLERVSLPKFNGDYFKWVTFRDLFVSLVINNKMLSKAQKLQMLKTNLTGEPEYLISDLTISDVNFDAAWGRLTHRYENNRVVVSQHLYKLVNQAPGKWESKSLKNLLDTTDQILLALKNLGRPTEHWDDWIVFTISQKFTEDCRKDWEKKIGTTTDLPTWQELKKFLEEEFRMLEGVENTQRKPHNQQLATSLKQSHVKVYQTTVENKGCAACGKDHKLFSCAEFKKMQPTVRWELAKKSKLCFSCLKPNHDKGSCTSKKPCKRCPRQHSTWLHEDRRGKSKDMSVNVVTKKEESPTTANKVIAVATISEQITTLQTLAICSTKQQVLLATALVLTTDAFGKTRILRALIDSGSQGSLMTTQTADLLQYAIHKTSQQIAPLGAMKRQCLKILTITIRPHFNSWFDCETEFYILPKLTRTLPDEDLNIQEWNHLKGLQLADPTFNKVGPIDILLGSDVVADIMKDGLIRGTKGQPIAQFTEFGWIVSGKIDKTYQEKRIQCLVGTMTNDNVDLQKFWELEELHPKRGLTLEEEQCERMFQETIQRNTDGSFTVKIPFKENDPQPLGTSRNQCLARFYQLERKLNANKELKMTYCNVMEEYITLGHMKVVQKNTEKLYYIPHHAVIKPDSLTTKTRVVFDASARTSTEKSLNDCMFTGAKQQKDLFEILIKWRKHRIVFKADIEKMYRKIHIDSADQRYHTVFWRKNCEDELKEYQLTRVTFGTAAAPFLATRTLKQLAMDNASEFPKAKEIIENDFYVDDLISGCDTLSTAIKVKEEVIQCLDKGNFTLRKWTSNNQELLDTLPHNMTEKSLQIFAETEITKALGLQWNPRTDNFGFKVSWYIEEGKITKRKLFSEASKLFDPLGWLAPTIIHAKLCMQEIWMAKIGWDEEVSQFLQEKWIQFREELPLLEQIWVPRWIEYDSDSEVQLHGFCDASEKAYAAVVFTRIQKGDHVEVRLIASKTRVAPINLKTTLPRLELCGAVLLSNLLKATEESLNIQNGPIIAWTDSMITLGWLNGTPSKWKTFVANRVSEVQATKINDWRHVKSVDNPADCASRGMLPNDLKNHNLWWEGPAWLKNHPDNWPFSEIIEEDCDESEKRSLVINVTTFETNDHVERASSWFTLVRITAYCLRMKYRKSRGAAITHEEMILATNSLIKQCQRDAFPEEVRTLKNGKSLQRTSKLLQLDPFLDNHGVMRVGGRIQNAPISFENKHPAILPQKHKVTTLLIRQMHENTLHGGPQLMLGLLRKRYWIMNAKRKITDEVKKCVTCRRIAAQTCNQQMGRLPEYRVSLERAFLNSTVDYAGPIDIKTSSIRNAKIQKAYIAVFVCLGTKAFHLEIVSDQTAEAFLAAFNRFIARRGLCNSMYSDNGGNFVKAASWLNNQQKNWLHQQNEEVRKVLTQKGIIWKFMPPESPNFGGLHERGVKSVKEHLKRTLKNACLTFEEYATVLCQVEACLNSRPLCPLTNNTEDLNALTPGHFLIGDALMAPPQQPLQNNNFNNLNRWRHLQMLQQHFWNRWHKEYLSQLQQRQKWKSGERNLQKGDVVLLKDEDLPPRIWLMGRVIETYPGTDGKVRVVSVRTHTNGDPRHRKVIILKRSVRKLCLLIPEESSNEVKEQSKSKDCEIKTNDNNQQRVEQKKTFKFVKNGRIKKKPVAPVKQVERKLRSRKITMATMLLALLSFVVIVGGETSKHPHVRTIKFEQNSGIHFENLGRARIIKSTWHIYVHCGLEKYFHEFKKLQEITQTLKQGCVRTNEMEATDHCHEISTLLMDKVAEMKRLNLLLKSNGEPTTEPEIRKVKFKRAAPLNVVGWAQHELFGVMAADQAEHIENQINKVQENGNHLLELIKKQTTLVEKTVHLMKIQENDINKNYEKIVNAMDQLQNETNGILKKETILGLALFTSLLISRFEKIQMNMLDLITDVQQGHISSNVFTPQQLKEQLVIINNNLPSGNKLFEDGQHDIKSIYRMMHCKTRVTDKNILLDISIPLVSIEEYQMYHVIPVPTKYQESFVSIIPESDYLMITLRKDNFYQISKQEFDTCVKPRPGTFLCGLRHPLYNSQSGRSQCERDVLEQKVEFSKRCKFNVTKKADFWMQLHDKNHWIFSLVKEAQLKIVCDNQLQTVTLKEAGIIELDPGCEAVSAGMTITAESDKTSEGSFNFIPTLDLSKTMIRSEQEQRLKLINTTIDHADQFNLIHDQIRDLKTQSHIDYIHHSTHHGMDIIIIVTFVSIGILTWYRRHWLLRKFKKWHTTNITTISMDHTQSNVINDEQRSSDIGKIHQRSSDDNQRSSDDNQNSGDKKGETSSTVGTRYAGENVQSKIKKDLSLYHSLRK